MAAENMSPGSGKIYGPDGEVYWLVDLLQSAGGGSGDMLKEIYDTDDDGVVDAAATAAVADSVAWDNVTGKPSTFTPATHSHPISQVTDLQTELDGKEDAGTAASAVSAHASGSAVHSIAGVSGLQSALDGKLSANAAAAVEAIADPATATAEEIATKLNELIAALNA